jgi:hypothetical protein
MASEIIKDTEFAFSGVVDIIQKAIIGLILSFSLLLFTRYLDFVFGIYWFSNDYFIILFVIIVSTVHSFRNHNKFNVSYIIGWVIGIYGLVFFDLIPSSKAIIYVIIPIIIVAFKRLLYH